MNGWGNQGDDQDLIRNPPSAYGSFVKAPHNQQTHGKSGKTEQANSKTPGSVQNRFASKDANRATGGLR